MERRTSSDNPVLILDLEDEGGTSTWVRCDRTSVSNIFIDIADAATVRVMACPNPSKDDFSKKEKILAQDTVDVNDEVVTTDPIIVQLGSTFTASGVYTIETSVPWVRVEATDVTGAVRVISSQTKI